MKTLKNQEKVLYVSIPTYRFWFLQFSFFRKLKPKNDYACPKPGCPWVGSRSGRSKHYRNKHPEEDGASAETPVQTATSGPGPSQRQPGSGHRDHISVRVKTQTGSYGGSLPLMDSSRLMNRPIHESTRIDQSETLESESDFDMTDDSQDPDWVPFN